MLNLMVIDNNLISYEHHISQIIVSKTYQQTR